jgi:hypothetical protein
METIVSSNQKKILLFNFKELVNMPIDFFFQKKLIHTVACAEIHVISVFVHKKSLLRPVPDNKQ